MEPNETEQLLTEVFAILMQCPQSCRFKLSTAQIRILTVIIQTRLFGHSFPPIPNLNEKPKDYAERIIANKGKAYKSEQYDKG